MDETDKTKLGYVLDAVTPLFEDFGVGILASDFVWSIVLGVLPCEGSEHEEMAMEMNRKDATIEKVKNIAKITAFAKMLTERPDYSDSNISSFTYAVRQLIRYTAGDAVATSYMKDLKNIYVSFITSYYYQSVEFGKRDDALNNVKSFGEDILHEDSYLREKLAEIAAFKSLS
ncbi:MAG: hypothetical protein JXB49_07840 [Bacteroidales bacterium]|nr:hypothetical protein [Bacteroidales bacterium]